MEFIVLGVLIVVFGGFFVALLRMAISGLFRALWWLLCLPFRVLRYATARPTPRTPEATQGCVVYQFPDRT